MNHRTVSIPLKRFLLTERCPLEWKDLDLYLFRDESVTFYVGQSGLAFARVWDHLLGGFHGHSVVGRFVWCNWPASMSFVIELMSSQSEEFVSIGNNLDAAERELIRRWSPCFNVSLNSQPTAVPDCYAPPNARFPRRQSLNRYLYEAERAVKADQRRHWIQELE
ncbi:MAG: hypothetical protein ACM3XO_16610 [Bacteroidota bacterium]